MADELEELDINLDDGFETIKPKDSKETNSIDDVELDIDELEEKPLVDTVKQELENTPKPPKLDDISLDVELDEPVKSEPEIKLDEPIKSDNKEELDIVLDESEEKLPELSNTEKISTPKSTPVKVEDVVEKPSEELDVIVEESPKSPEPKKRGRKAKVAKDVFKSNGRSYGGCYDPIFKLDEIKIGKYNIRHTARTTEEINDLANDIKIRGQLEPLHLVKESDGFHLIAGYGRYEALKINKAEMCRVIYYENITEEDIFGIATGTNQKRNDLSSWDNIVSIHKFMEMHKDYPVFAENDGVSICSIFGIGKSTAYAYIELHKYFIQSPEYVKILKEKKIPYHMLISIYESRESIKDHDDVMKLILNNPEANRKEFKDALSTMIINTEIETEIDMEIDKDVDKVTSKAIDKEAKEIAEKENIETITKITDNKKVIASKISEISELYTKISSLLMDVFAIDNSVNLMDNLDKGILKKKHKDSENLFAKLLIL